jgi:hypothetical protein
MDAVILVGVQAAGKSTFYRERFFATHVRIRLDLLRTRHRERSLMARCLGHGQRSVQDGPLKGCLGVAGKRSGFESAGRSR